MNNDILRTLFGNNQADGQGTNVGHGNEGGPVHSGSHPPGGIPGLFQNINPLQAQALIEQLQSLVARAPSTAPGLGQFGTGGDAHTRSMEFAWSMTPAGGVDPVGNGYNFGLDSLDTGNSLSSLDTRSGLSSLDTGTGLSSSMSNTSSTPSSAYSSVAPAVIPHCASLPTAIHTGSSSLLDTGLPPNAFETNFQSAALPPHPVTQGNTTTLPPNPAPPTPAISHVQSSPPTFNRMNFPGRFWDKKAWQTWIANTKFTPVTTTKGEEKGGILVDGCIINKRYYYMEGADGRMLSGDHYPTYVDWFNDRLHVMYAEGQLPADLRTESLVGKPSMIRLTKETIDNFPEFAWCNGNYKLKGFLHVQMPLFKSKIKRLEAQAAGVSIPKTTGKRGRQTAPEVNPPLPKKMKDELAAKLEVNDAFITPLTSGPGDGVDIESSTAQADVEMNEGAENMIQDSEGCNNTPLTQSLQADVSATQGVNMPMVVTEGSVPTAEKPKPKARPIISKLQSTISMPQPAADTPQLMANTPQPAPDTPQLMANTPQPAPDMPQPMANTSQPVANTPQLILQPTANTPQLIPQLIADTPQLIPQPTADTPQLIPQPTADTPQLVPQLTADTPQLVPQLTADMPQLLLQPTADTPQHTGNMPQPMANMPLPTAEVLQPTVEQSHPDTAESRCTVKNTADPGSEIEADYAPQPGTQKIMDKDDQDNRALNSNSISKAGDNSNNSIAPSSVWPIAMQETMAETQDGALDSETDQLAEDDHDSTDPAELRTEHKVHEDCESAVPPELQGANRQLLLDLMAKQSATEGKAEKTKPTSTKTKDAPPKKKAASKPRKTENVRSNAEKRYEKEGRTQKKSCLFNTWWRKQSKEQKEAYAAGWIDECQDKDSNPAGPA